METKHKFMCYESTENETTTTTAAEAIKQKLKDAKTKQNRKIEKKKESK